MLNLNTAHLLKSIPTEHAQSIYMRNPFLRPLHFESSNSYSAEKLNG